MQEKGLASEYNNEVFPVFNMVRRLFTLLKIGDIDTGYDYAVEAKAGVDDDSIIRWMDQILDYVKNTWTSPSALFDSSIWSRYDVQGSSA